MTDSVVRHGDGVPRRRPAGAPARDGRELDRGALPALCRQPLIATYPSQEARTHETQTARAFNKGDVAAAAASCAEQTSIIDEFAPYEWHGAGACARWMGDYDADAKRNAITGGVVTLGAPRHVDVSGDRAYLVVPADYAYAKKGKPVKEVASTLTIALTKSAGGWKMTGWTWAKR